MADDANEVATDPLAPAIAGTRRVGRSDGGRNIYEVPSAFGDGRHTVAAPTWHDAIAVAALLDFARIVREEGEA